MGPCKGSNTGLLQGTVRGGLRGPLKEALQETVQRASTWPLRRGSSRRALERRSSRDSLSYGPLAGLSKRAREGGSWRDGPSRDGPSLNKIDGPSERLLSRWSFCGPSLHGPSDERSRWPVVRSRLETAPRTVA
jgi:hypothetical protein